MGAVAAAEELRKDLEATLRRGESWGPESLQQP
jgi:hypothetical protein